MSRPQICGLLGLTILRGSILCTLSLPVQPQYLQGSDVSLPFCHMKVAVSGLSKDFSTVHSLRHYTGLPAKTRPGAECNDPPAC